MASMIEKWSVLAAARFVLASIVAATHIAGYGEPGMFTTLAKFGAFEAILGFLLISGYSIGHSYHQQPDGFLIRRIRRLYPVYLASLAVTYAATQVHDPNATTNWFVLALNALFLNQLFTTTSYLGPAWSLSLEFWLYCFAPFLMAWPARRVNALAWISLGAYLLYTAARAMLGLPYFADLGYGLNLILLAFPWIAGLMLSRQKGEERTSLRTVSLMFAAHWLLALGLKVAWSVKHGAMSEFWLAELPEFFCRGLTLAAVCVGFHKFVIAQAAGARKSWTLRFLGDVSYPLYLLHVPLCMLLAAAGLRSAALYYVIAVICSGLVYQVLDTYSKKRHLGMEPVGRTGRSPETRST